METLDKAQLQIGVQVNPQKWRRRLWLREVVKNMAVDDLVFMLGVNRYGIAGGMTICARALGMDASFTSETIRAGNKLVGVKVWRVS